MRISAFVLTVATAVALLAQSSPSYHVIHTFALDGMGVGTTLCPIHPAIGFISHARIV
jgi:hypothetical protein